MKTIIDQITEELQAAFAACGYASDNIRASLSNRPDLCEYQCNGAMPLAKSAHKVPIAIASDVAAALGGSALLSDVQAVKPGFLNLKLREEYLVSFLNEMGSLEKMGIEPASGDAVRTIVMDYGGPNVAKPLHVGHLRSAVIGESIKRILRYAGHRVIGDVHLGDWGLQMGLIITELSQRQPDLVYFDPDYTGEYPAEAPFTVSELEEIYPTASAKSKEDASYKEKALEATAQLQAGRRGYAALLDHILHVSVTDLKRNYENLNVSFDLWYGESDAQKYVPDMIDGFISGGYAYESEGALVVDIAEESDKKELPPCIVRKSDGASLYATTDLATLVQREQDFHPDMVIYVVDKRQELHFTQGFRTAKKTGIIRPETQLLFKGFGTMNGKDGKPFKTRAGGVMRLEYLLDEINAEMLRKIEDNYASHGKEAPDPDEAAQTAKIVGLSALKYGDLSNQASKDYVFDIDRFTSFEGNTGPYILYTIVRIKTILNKYRLLVSEDVPQEITPTRDPAAKSLMLEMVRWNEVIREAAAETAPHKVCAFLYDLSNAFNHFYHETQILSEPDEDKRGSYAAILSLTLRELETGIDLLGFSAPEHM